MVYRSTDQIMSLGGGSDDYDGSLMSAANLQALLMQLEKDRIYARDNSGGFGGRFDYTRGLPIGTIAEAPPVILDTGGDSSSAPPVYTNYVPPGTNTEDEDTWLDTLGDMIPDKWKERGKNFFLDNILGGMINPIAGMGGLFSTLVNPKIEETPWGTDFNKGGGGILGLVANNAYKDVLKAYEGAQAGEEGYEFFHPEDMPGFANAVGIRPDWLGFEQVAGPQSQIPKLADLNQDGRFTVDEIRAWADAESEGRKAYQEIENNKAAAQQEYSNREKYLKENGGSGYVGGKPVLDSDGNPVRGADGTIVSNGGTFKTFKKPAKTDISGITIEEAPEEDWISSLGSIFDEGEEVPVKTPEGIITSILPKESYYDNLDMYRGEDVKQPTQIIIPNPIVEEEPVIIFPGTHPDVDADPTPSYPNSPPPGTPPSTPTYPSSPPPGTGGGSNNPPPSIPSYPSSPPPGTGGGSSKPPSRPSYPSSPPPGTGGSGDNKPPSRPSRPRPNPHPPSSGGGSSGGGRTPGGPPGTGSGNGGGPQHSGGR